MAMPAAWGMSASTCGAGEDLSDGAGATGVAVADVPGSMAVTSMSPLC